jgi:menaquinone-dependent protoporphyrinogen oxidase
MSTSILVAYATSTGSTKEVAEAIAATLRASGLEVDIKPLREVNTLKGYRAVVMGAPLFMLQWHKDALRFLARHRKALPDLPVAVFALGPLHDTEKEWNEVRAQLDKALAKCPWFTPTAVQIFGGVANSAKLALGWRLLPGLKNMPASDLRDWDAIKAWAGDLAVEFQLPAHDRNE